MMQCLNCKKDTQNPKFCSRSCAVTVNNHKVGNRWGTDTNKCCLACGEFTGKNTYCSNACQGEKRKRDNLNDWLAGKVTHLPRVAKNFVLEDQQYKCSICKMVNEWNGQPLVFVLDHIDGDSSNNRRDNLRAVCPNCDSQLPTFKSKNKGKGRHSRRQRYIDGKSY